MTMRLLVAGLFFVPIAALAQLSEAELSRPMMVGPDAGVAPAEEHDIAATVDMTNSLEFVPARIVVEAGDTVEWRNTSQQVHTVTADPSLAQDPEHIRLPPGADAFNSGNLPPGETYRHTFEEKGTYHYVCLVHEMQGMMGTVVVREAPGEAVTLRGP